MQFVIPYEQLELEDDEWIEKIKESLLFVILTLLLDDLVNFWFCWEGFLSRKKLSMNTSTLSIRCDSCSYSGL